MGVIAADVLTGIRAQFQPGPGITFLDSATYGLPPQATVAQSAISRVCIVMRMLLFS